MLGKKVNPAPLQHHPPRHSHQPSASLRAQLGAVGVFLSAHFAGKQQNATAPSLLSPPAPQPDIPWVKPSAAVLRRGGRGHSSPSAALITCFALPRRLTGASGVCPRCSTSFLTARQVANKNLALGTGGSALTARPRGWRLRRAPRDTPSPRGHTEPPAGTPNGDPKPGGSPQASRCGTPREGRSRPRGGGAEPRA